MNLSFARKFPSRKKVLAGKETNFIEKIFQSLNYFDLTKFDDYSRFCDRCDELGLIDYDYLEHVFSEEDKGKIHTIRKDESERWKEGMPIHYLIDIDKDEQFQFAPVVRCTGKERIIITHVSFLPKPLVQVGEFLLNTQQIKDLATNDGFDSVDDFFGWFDSDYKGWIIHWTPFRYDINEIEVNEVEIFGKDGPITKAMNGSCSDMMTESVCCCGLSSEKCTFILTGKCPQNKN